MASSIPTFMLPTPKPTPNPYFERNQSFALPGPYITKLTPEEEKQFQAWALQNRVPMEDDGPRSGYDMRGFWKALMASDPRAKTGNNPVDKRLHFPDIWKTPYHQSFSNESIYATPNNPFFWKGETLIDRRTNRPVFETK